jgi:hypothetical protein
MGKMGWLLYKCRLCGSVNREVHVPGLVIALSCILNNYPLPKDWAGGDQIHSTSIHHCADNKLGVSDIVGGERD